MKSVTWKKRVILMKCLRVLMVLTILFVSMGLGSNISTAQSHMYPLQTKYPDIMIYKANTNKKVIALTFDDGPDHRFTPYILDVLNMHDVKATFFLLGVRVAKYPDVAKRIYNEGHVIGSHTYWHPDLTKTGTENLLWEMKESEKVIKSVTNFKPNLFRAPYGALTESLVLELGKMNYRGVGWSVDSEDWKSIPSAEIKQKVISGIHPGAIILMHSAGNWTQDLSGTAEALNELIPFLREQGYEFVTVPELLSL